NSRNRSLPEASGNRSGVVGNLSVVSGRSHGEALRSKFSGEKRVHFTDSLLIPQDGLNMACASLPEFVGKREEDPVRFLLQLKAQAGTWWGTMRALDLPWQEFKSELLEKFNGDELQSSLQSELLSTAQTKTESLGEYVLHKYQLYWRLNLGLTEEAVVMTVVGLMRDEFRIHARILRLKSFSELRALAHLELAEGSPDAGKNDPELTGADRNPSGEIEDSPVEPDDAPVINDAYPVASSFKAPSTYNTPEVPGKGNLSVGDWVYYKAHPQSSAEKRFHAGFAPKWLGPVKLGKPLGTRVFLTEGKHPTKLHVSAMKRAMAERVNPPQTRNNRPFRGMIATHVEKLRAMAAQLLREARRLTGEGSDDAVGGWSAERAATASFGQIRASPTAWALFERGFAEGRRSTRETIPQAGARPRAGPPGRVPPRRTAPAYQRHDVRDRRGRFQQGQQQDLSVMLCYGYPGYLVTHGNRKSSALVHRIEKCND
ncbi:putative global transcription activator SNF2L2, partial [Aphis craccivora]